MAVSGVLQDVGHLGRLEEGVHGYEDTAGQGHTEGTHHPLGTVAHEQGHSGALVGAGGHQSLGETTGLRGQLGVGPVGSGRPPSWKAIASEVAWRAPTVGQETAGG